VQGVGCAVTGCPANAFCDRCSGCYCKLGYCLDNSGTACVRNPSTPETCDVVTGGTCHLQTCSSSRGPNDCIHSNCLCKEGYCAKDGVCVADAERNRSGDGPSGAGATDGKRSRNGDDPSGAGATDDTSAPVSSKALLSGLLVLLAAASAITLTSGKLPPEVGEVLPSWKLFFFVGACCVLAGGTIPIVYRLVHLEWAPFTFVDTVFLTGFGIFMVVLDFPSHYPKGPLVTLRDNLYRYVLFLTRFMGRGLWYLFLATLVFQALSPVPMVVRFIFTAYLVLLGVCALVKGYLLSSQLDKVRQEIIRIGHGAEHYVGRTKALSKTEFEEMVDFAVSKQKVKVKFSSDDLDNIINAMSFTPYNDGQVSLEECEYWLREGPMLYV